MPDANDNVIRIGDIVIRRTSRNVPNATHGVVTGFGYTGRPAVKWKRHNGRTTHLNASDLVIVGRLSFTESDTPELVGE